MALGRARANHRSGTGHLICVVLLLALYLVSRLHNLASLPLFVDESLYIETAQRVHEGQFLNSAVTNGRLLHVWYNAYLSPYPPAIGWVARAGMVMAGMLALAAIYGLVRSMISHRAGVLAVLLWIAAPYLLFFERMTLADTMLNTTSVVLVWLSWKLAKTGKPLVALGVGGMLFVVLMAKVTALVWLPLPAVAVSLMQHARWQRRLELAGIAYSAFLMLAGPFGLVLRVKNYNYLGLGDYFVGGVDSNLFERTWHNIQLIWKFDIAYLSWPLVVLALLGGLLWLFNRPRSAFFTLFVLGMVGGGSLLFGLDVNSRRVVSHVPWIIVSVAAGVTLLGRHDRRWQWVAYGALGLWALGFSVPFQFKVWNDPARLPLNENDTREYITGEASGYGVTEIGQQLKDMQETLPTLGFVANCLTLRYAAYPVDVTCPRIAWEGTNQAQLMQQAESWAAQGPVWVVGESLPYIDLAGLPVPHRLITVVDRPGGTQLVALYRLEQGAQQPQSRQ